ncbi:MarR family winged helix-turn-helix transcriptional regulator [Levilactobacillus yiduensis]|uniref:MarR family winged helix-turn-helix transcriptional regulator n=1 Tax=Levilactobacillus yiduensis TaxID=2953880 RepID=UPI000EF2DCCD|nr:helix-turn-helix domain-containing protein [Levilactobacillus yiduensis]AYM01984.1 MarR family transcriptional regulator [Levilactobacillus brevis]
MPEQEQLQKLTQIYTLVTQCYNQPLPELAINLPQCQLMSYVAAEQMTVAQVAHKLNFSATRTSNLVVDLCKRGYLKQQVADHDRRRRYLGLTQVGTEKMALIQQQLPTILQETLRTLRDES